MLFSMQSIQNTKKLKSKSMFALGFKRKGKKNVSFDSDKEQKIDDNESMQNFDYDLMKQLSDQQTEVTNISHRKRQFGGKMKVEKTRRTRNVSRKFSYHTDFMDSLDNDDSYSDSMENNAEEHDNT
eukprot:63289_1